MKKQIGISLAVLCAGVMGFPNSTFAASTESTTSTTSTDTSAIEYSDDTYDYEFYQNSDGANCARIVYCNSTESMVFVPSNVSWNGKSYNITELKDYSFSFITPVSVILSEGITTIDGSAFFENSTLESVQFPSSMTSIGDWAFGECTALRSVSLQAMAQVGDWAFCDCTALSCVDLSGATSLGADAFNGCENMTCVFLSSNLKSVGAEAFYGCSNLKNVYFEGTQSEWEQIQMGTDNESLTTATIHFIESSDADCSIKNVILLQKYLLRQFSINSTQAETFDRNQDDIVNVLDLCLLKREYLQSAK